MLVVYYNNGGPVSQCRQLLSITYNAGAKVTILAIASNHNNGAHVSQCRQQIWYHNAGVNIC